MKEYIVLGLFCIGLSEVSQNRIGQGNIFQHSPTDSLNHDFMLLQNGTDEKLYVPLERGRP